MPAYTPEDVHELFAKYFSAGDLEALVSLYEPDAAMVQQSGPPLNGLAAIRANLANFLALNGQMILTVARVIQGGDIALLLSKWTLKGTDPSGGAVELAGQTSDVVRRQKDGTWLLIIDNPYGAAAAS
ncbi:MAG TPA: nuclear transport factor 2 family protein [Pyrinomonadaceae bacterium]|nr:nuclear transport factor 2 family protein [Pyrinomonadaceae bacterium]